MSNNKIVVEYFYLDLKTCQRCIGTDNILDEVMKTITPALSLAGYETEYKKIKMENSNIAMQYKFLSSPTIRVNGRDICQSVSENNCDCCGKISDTEVNCRVFEFKGKKYEVPPKEMLAHEILKSAFSETKNEPDCDYRLPENLNNFYKGIKIKKCLCSEKCC